ncbi:hypothetical protein ACF0H5_019989 [Mactra antiquata]
MFQQISRFLLVVVFGCMIFLCQVDYIKCHGRLWEPPSRSSMWRRGYNTSVNINDNELSCGGFTNQWIAYGGLCGVCGDPYQQNPRDNENGGKYASGLITRIYPIGRNIDVVIGLTANHEGYFEFRLCPVHETTIIETQACMERHPLRIVNGDENGSKFYIKDPTVTGDIHLQLELPSNFKCQHCVLRWRYRTGTRWGCDTDKTCGSGKGPQEEFYGCSDIAVSNVPSVVYNDPVINPEYGTVGLNDLGSASTRRDDVTQTPQLTQIWTRKRYNTQSASEMNQAKKYTGYVSPSPTMTHFNEFLENITLNALINYYGHKWNKIPGNCSPIKRFSRNPIVHEYCRRICSPRITECPTNLCVCSAPNFSTPSTLDTSISANREGTALDTNHLRKFVRRLIVKNKLSMGDKPLAPRSEAVTSRFDSPATKAPFNGRQLEKLKPSLNTNANSVNKAKTGVTKDIENSGFVTLGKPGRIQPKSMNCKASDDFSHNPYMTKWCETNCPFGFCPKRVCSCS